MKLVVCSFVCLAVPALAQPTPGTVSADVDGGRSHLCLFYPVSALRVHAQGTATVAFTVTAAGTVTGVSIKRSSGNSALDDAAIACVQKWTYPPPTDSRLPKGVQKEVAIAWKLNDVLPPPREIVVPVVTCISKAHPSSQALGRATGDTVVEVRFGGSRPYTDIWRTSGNMELDGLVADCAEKLPPELFPSGMRFVIPFSWKPGAPTTPK